MRLAAIPRFFRNQIEVHSVPGPLTLSPLTFGREMSRDTLGYMQSLMQTYGDLVHMPFPLRPIFQVSDPDLVGKVLMGTGKTNIKSLGYRRIQLLLGDGLLTSEGALWRQQRRLANPAFHQKMLDTFSRVIVSETQKMADEWEERIKTDPIVDVSRDIARLAFTIIVKCLFSVDMSQKAEAVKEALSHLQNYANYLFYSLLPLPVAVPTQQNLQAKRAMKTINSIVFEIIDEHQRNPEAFNDLLTAYMEARDEESGAVMDRQLLRDEVVTLMLAGHETTAFSLSIALSLLTEHPEAMQKMEAELGDFTPDLSKQSKGKPSYCSLVFQETIRLYPAAWAVGRELTEECEHKGFVLPAGSTVLLVQYLTHRNPRYWNQPAAFQPERFLPEQSAQRHPFAYFPFGGGSRTCIGSNLAKLEAQLILPLLLQRFKMSAVRSHQYKIHPRISMTFDPGVKLRLEKR